MTVSVVTSDTGFCQPLNTSIADISTTENFTPLFIMDLASERALEVGDVVDAWIEFQATTPNDDRPVGNTTSPISEANMAYEYKRIGSVCAFMALAEDTTLDQNGYVYNRISGNTGTNNPFLIHHTPVRQHGRFVVTDTDKRYLVGVAYAEVNKSGWSPYTVDYLAGECRMCYTITRGATDSGLVGNGSDLIVPSNDWGTAFSANVASGSNGWTGHTSRSVFQTSALTMPAGTPTQIKVTIKAGDTEGYTIDKMYVGHAAGSGDAYDFSTTPVALDFSGSAGVALSAGQEAVGTATFSYNKTSPLIVSEHCSGDSSHDRRAFLASVTGVTVYYKSAVDEAATVDVTGYTSYSGVQLIKKIEMDGF